MFEGERGLTAEGEACCEVVLFDLDGTLTDPAPGILGGIRHACAALGVAAPPDAALVRYIGPPLLETFAGLAGVGPAQARAAIEHYRIYFGARGLYENAVYPGIEALLTALSERGAALYVATSKPTVYAERIVEHFGLAPYFRAVVGSNLDHTRVSKAEVIGHILDAHLRGRRAGVLMVGDREHDILGARQHGIPAAGVAYGYGTLDELRAARPRHLVTSVPELARLLAPSPQP